MNGQHIPATHARAPHYADGGLIGSIKEKFFGPAAPKETLTEKFARQDAEIMAKAAKRNPPPAPAAAPPATPAANTISGYAGMSAMQAREKAAGLKDGGKVKGPGGVDNVPIMATKDEYMLPVDTTKALGGAKVLDKIVAATHKPISAMAKKKSRQALANGGTVEEKKKNSFGDAAAATSAAVQQIPTGGNAPAPAAQPGNFLTDSELGRNVTNTLAAVAPGGGRIASGLIAGLGKVAAAGVASPALAKVAPYVPPAAGAAGLALAAAPATSSSPTLQASTSPPAAPVPAAPGPLTAPAASTTPAQGVITRLGNSYSGTNVPAGATIDNPRNPGAGVTSLPATPVAAVAPAAEPAPGLVTFGNAAVAEREALNASNTLNNQRGTLDAAVRLSTSPRERVAAMQALSSFDQGQTQRSVAQGREAGDSSRAAATDATARRGQTLAAGQNNTIAALAQKKFDLEAGGTQLDNAAKQRVADAQTRLLDPKATEAERETARETLRALRGTDKELPNRFTVVPGGQAVTELGVPYTQPASVINNTTGAFVDQPQRKSGPPPGLVVGAATRQADGVYSAAGKTVTIKSGKVTEIK